jgi:hypothetical protein
MRYIDPGFHPPYIEPESRYRKSPMPGDRATAEAPTI